jgi:hypothetical protein
MNIDLTPIIRAIIALLAAIVTYKVIPWIKARTTNEQQTLLKAVTTTLVFAAEQLYGAGNGSDKLDYVIRHLEYRGFTADRDMIEAIIKEFGQQLHAPKLATNQETEEPIVE